MAKFAEEDPDAEFVQQVVAQLPWGHNVVLLDKIADIEKRKWYIEHCAENGWSRNVLIHQIESGLYERQAIAEKISNFETKLPAPQSELAIQTMKDPYIEYKAQKGFKLFLCLIHHRKQDIHIL